MFSNSRLLPGGRSKDGKDHGVLQLWASKLDFWTSTLYERRTGQAHRTAPCHLPSLQVMDVPFLPCATFLQRQLKGLGTWCLLESGWDEKHPGGGTKASQSQCPSASCGCLQGFPVSQGSPWKYHPHPSPLPLAASGCSATGSRSDSLFPCACALGFSKAQGSALLGLWYLLGAINAIKREEEHIWERLWLLLLPGDAARAAGSPGPH